MPRGIYLHKKRQLPERFWEKVNIAHIDDCWAMGDEYGAVWGRDLEQEETVR